MSFLNDMNDVLCELFRLESQFRHDMRRNPNFHSDLSDNVDVLEDIITGMCKIMNEGKSGETK